MLLAVVLALTGQTDRLDKYLLAFMLGGVITVGLWAVYPSFGAATYLYSTGAATGLPPLEAVYSFVKPQLALHSVKFVSINLTELTGVVGAPSFHTIMSLLTVWAVAGFGIWFWLVAGWNVFVLASIPVFGGHHFADMLAGSLVAAVSIVIAKRVSSDLKADKNVMAAAFPETIVPAE